MKGRFIDFTPISEWGVFDGMSFPVIAGPCSAETFEQVQLTSRGVADAGVKVLRAGLWKPRTRPGSFEGVGVMGLPWLDDAKKSFGLKIIVEVANKEHVYACLSAGVDMVWIGARTTSNPFLVEEIAQALAGSDIPVLVKNPISPDLDLWVGALERFSRVGIRKLGAIHRGFSPYDRIKYRNDPRWRVVLELRSLYPELPIFVDPSHIAGDKQYVREVSQRAIDFGFDGLMIESHSNPLEALSDANQQLTPIELSSLLNNELTFRSEVLSGDDKEIRDLRRDIDLIDENIIYLIHLRLKACMAIGGHKKSVGSSVFQKERWKMVMSNVLEKGREYGLSEYLIKDIFNSIHGESVILQKEIMENKYCD